MAKTTPRRGDPVTLKHYTLFGQIVVEYAALEVGFKIMLAGYMGLGIHRALVYSAPYTAQSLRNVVKAATKIDVPNDNPVYDSIIEAIGAHKGASQIRNDIGHNLWRKGDRPKSIAPVYMEIRNDRAEMKGREDENRDYTIAEIERVLASLRRASEQLIAFQSAPEFRRLVERNVSPKSSDSDMSEGNS